MANDLAQRNEEGRWQVLKHLAERPAVALPAEAVADGLTRRGFPCSTAEVLVWLLFWVEFSPAHVRKSTPDFGSTEYFQVLSPGILRIERGGM